MQTRKRITILTPQTMKAPSITDSDDSPSPTITKKAPVQYRIEERTRTIYVSSDVDPTKWDEHSITEILRVTEIADAAVEVADHDLANSPQSHSSIRRSKSQPPEPILESISDTRSTTSSPGAREYPPRATNKSNRRQTRISGPSLHVPTQYVPPISPVWATPKNSYEPQRILFYDKNDPYYGFTNFSSHPVVYKGKRYPTSEHLFQSFKFHDYKPGLAEHIRTCSERPSVAFSEARRFQPEVRPDWLQINIKKMEDVLWHKFTQHADLRAELLSTGNAELVEASDKDAFWGWGADHHGRNELGKALERLREKLLIATRAPVVQNQLPAQLCDQCHQKPKFSNHQYCSKTCAAQASAMCKYCHKKPKFQNFDYCGKNCAAQANVVAPNAQAPVATMAALQQGPLPKVAANIGGKANLPKTFNPVAQVAKFVTQQMPQTLLPSTTVQSTQPAGQVNGSGPTSTSLVQGFNPFSNVTNQQPQPQQLAANGMSAQVPASTQPPAPPLPCLIPGCGKPVHIDSQGNSTDYCSKKHREEAVPLGLASPCIMCLTMPQCDADYFCSKACRDEALNKV